MSSSLLLQQYPASLISSSTNSLVFFEGIFLFLSVSLLILFIRTVIYIYIFFFFVIYVEIDRFTFGRSPLWSTEDLLVIICFDSSCCCWCLSI